MVVVNIRPSRPYKIMPHSMPRDPSAIRHTYSYRHTTRGLLLMALLAVIVMALLLLLR